MRPLLCGFALAVIAQMCTDAHADVAVGAEEPAAPVIAPTPVPRVDPAHELSGRSLVEALRMGGYVLYMRHALQIVPASGSCKAANLTPVGEDEARRVGAAIRELKIPIGEVRASEPCRNRDTARLLGLGDYVISEDLNPAGTHPGFDVHAARFRQLAEVPPAGKNTLLVSHVHGSQKKEEWMQLQTAEIIVYRPDGQGGTLPVARIRVEEWEGLTRLMGDKP